MYETGVILPQVYKTVTSLRQTVEVSPKVVLERLTVPL